MVIHFSLIHSVVNRHLNCFYSLAIMNNASVNTCAQVFVWIDVSFHFLLGIYQGVELLAYVVNLRLTL